MKSIIIIGLIIIVLCSAGYFYFIGSKQTLKPIEVRVTAVQSGSFTASTLGQGNLIARKKEQLVSTISGVILDNKKYIGQFLHRGTVIAMVRLLEPELSKKKQDLEFALLDLEILDEQVQQSEDLFKVKAISERELKALKIQKYKQEKFVQSLREEVSDKPVITTFGGMLVEKFFHDGDRINAGAPLAIIIDTSSYAVEIKIGQHQIPFIKLGQRITFSSQTFPGERQGTVLEIARAANNNQNSQSTAGEMEPEFTILASIETLHFDNLLLGSQIDARFILQEKDKTIFVPTEAILYRNDTTIIFLAHKGISRKCLIKTGLSNDRFVEIVDGLIQGDTVVTSGNLDIEDGSSILITGDEHRNDQKKFNSKLNFFTF